MVPSSIFIYKGFLVIDLGGASYGLVTINIGSIISFLTARISWGGIIGEVYFWA